MVITVQPQELASEKLTDAHVEEAIKATSR